MTILRSILFSLAGALAAKGQATPLADCSGVETAYRAHQNPVEPPQGDSLGLEPVHKTAERRPFVRDVILGTVGEQDVAIVLSTGRIDLKNLQSNELICSLEVKPSLDGNFSSVRRFDRPTEDGYFSMSSAALAPGGNKLAIAGDSYLAIHEIDLAANAISAGNRLPISPETTPEFFMALYDKIRVSWSPDRRALITTASTAEQSIIRLWDAMNGRSMGAMVTPEKLIRGHQNAVGFGPDYQTMYALTRSGVELYDVARGLQLQSLSFPRGIEIVTGEISPDLRGLGVVLKDGDKYMVGIYEIATQRLHAAFDLLPGENPLWLRFQRTKSVIQILTDQNYYQLDARTNQVITKVHMPRGRFNHKLTDASFLEDNAAVVVAAPWVEGMDFSNRSFGVEIYTYGLP